MSARDVSARYSGREGLTALLGGMSTPHWNQLALKIQLHTRAHTHRLVVGRRLERGSTLPGLSILPSSLRTASERAEQISHLESS